MRLFALLDDGLVRWTGVVGAFVLTGAYLLVAGCGVPGDGRVGIGKDTDGSLQVYLRTCHHALDGAVLYWPDDPNGANSNEETFTAWTISPQPDPLRVQWPFLGSGVSGVGVNPVLTAVPGPLKDLTIVAGTNDNSYSARGPESFTKADLDALKPGQILIANEDGDPTDPKRPLNVVVDRPTFDALDCEQYG